jgi:hypothetical protein
MNMNSNAGPCLSARARIGEIEVGRIEKRNKRQREQMSKRHP